MHCLCLYFLCDVVLGLFQYQLISNIYLSNVLCHITVCYVTLFDITYVKLRYATLRYVMLYGVTLCYAILYENVTHKVDST